MLSYGLPAASSKDFNYIADIRLPSGPKLFCVFFAIAGFNLSVRVHNFNTVIQSMNNHNYKVSPDFPRIKGEDLIIFVILGNDILQEFDQYCIL